MFSRENDIQPKGMRDYFDRPRELRIAVPEGHDGVSEPFEIRPSLHYLRYQDSPKFQRIRGSSTPRRAPSVSDSVLSPLSPADESFRTEERGEETPRLPNCAVGSAYGTPTKPDFQRSASWHLTPEKVPSSERRKPALNQASAHYSEKSGSAGRKKEPVLWNNRWHLTPSKMGQKLHPAFREYFDKPSRMYTSTTEAWRHMYGDKCELLNVRMPGPAALSESGAYGLKAALKMPKIVPAAVNRMALEVVDGPPMKARTRTPDTRTPTRTSRLQESASAPVLPPIV